MKKTKILFLCNGNSCRSKIAEAWAKKLYPEFEAFSAGVEPHSVNLYAIKVMEEKNILLSPETNHAEFFIGKEIDYVITVCDKASKKCPLKFKDFKILHKNIPGPSKIARTKTTEQEKLDCYRTTRDELYLFIQNLPHFISNFG